MRESGQAGNELRRRRCSATRISVDDQSSTTPLAITIELMSFALPIAFTLAALAVPIVALYILKVRLRRVPVSTNLFWRQIYEEKPPRSIWQHFRHLLSLLLQLLLLMLMVLAIADPCFSWQLLKSRRLVVVIDNSASMRATDVAPSRLDAAKAAASQIIDGMRIPR